MSLKLTKSLVLFFLSVLMIYHIRNHVVGQTSIDELLYKLVPLLLLVVVIAISFFEKQFKFQKIDLWVVLIGILIEIVFFVLYEKNIIKSNIFIFIELIVFMCIGFYFFNRMRTLAKKK